MTEYMYAVCAFIVVLTLSLLMWVAAHSSIATECDKLGSFYVGDKVYECKRKAQTP